MTEYEEIEQKPGFKDRKTRLVVFGILQIILGSFCALMLPMMILGTIASAVTSQDTAQAINIKMMIPGILFYALIAAWFIIMGIGSVKARRWARAIILVSSWLWLICGVYGLVFVLLMLPNMFDQMGESGEIPRAAFVIIKFVMIGFMAVFYVIIPGLLVLFYKGRDVKATCEYRDPQIRWTDKCPLPVLGVSMVSVFWAVSMLSMMVAYGGTIPIFGVILSGIPGAIVLLALALLLAYTARGTYRLDIKAWWCALLTIVGWSISMIITFSTVDMQTYYIMIGLTPQQLDAMSQVETLWGPTMSLFLGLWAIVAVVYLFYIRKYFVGDSQENDPSQVLNQP